MKKSLKAQGFTLLELLVVVAIISLLSSVVLASFSGSRDDARDTAVKQEMRQMQTQAQIWLQNNSVYTVVGANGKPLASNFDNEESNCARKHQEGSFFDVETGVGDIILSVFAKRNPRLNGWGTRGYCGITPDSWAVAVPLHSADNGTGWSTDSSGYIGPVNFDFRANNFDNIRNSNGEASCR